MKTVLIAIALMLPLCAQVKITQQGKDKISVEIDGKPFTDFYIGPQTAKPYLYPLRTADGKIVTRGFPMVTDIPGEAHDHPHHRGLWFTHGDVNGYDFWGNEPDQKGAGKGKGTVVLERVDKFVTGKKSGTISASFAWKIASGETMLIENRKMTFYSDPQLRIIDFDITLIAAGGSQIRRYQGRHVRHAPGRAARRGAAQGHRRAKRTGKMVNAQNKSGEKNVWGKRSEWVDYSGKIDGAHGWRRDIRPPVQPAVSHLLARARLWAVCDQHFRPARFRARPRARRQPDHTPRPAAALPLSRDRFIPAM